MKIFDGKAYRDMTPEEIERINHSSQLQESQEAHRPLDQSEVLAIIAPKIVNTLDIPDSVSVRMKDYYPAFSEIIGQTVKMGYKFTHNGNLYKVKSPELTIQEHYPPGPGTESMYERIDEQHLGNLYDPIPFDGNMTLQEGKHYTQSGVLYRCTIGSGNPVYRDLRDFVGIYVEIVDWPSFF